MEATRREGKWSRVVITFLAPALAIFFTGSLIFQSGFLRPGGIWLQKPDMGNVITQIVFSLKIITLTVAVKPACLIRSIDYR
jgi:hypothetical protein